PANSSVAAAAMRRACDRRKRRTQRITMPPSGGPLPDLSHERAIRFEARADLRLCCAMSGLVRGIGFRRVGKGARQCAVPTRPHLGFAAMRMHLEKISTWARRVPRLCPPYVGALAALLATPALAQDPIADFYKGKQVNIIVGSSAGGGYDTYARLL